MSENKLVQFFVSLDTFGRPLSVNYKGSDTYKTKLGAFCTLAVYVLMAINLINLTTAYVSNSNQVEKTNTLTAENWKTKKFNLID